MQLQIYPHIVADNGVLGGQPVIEGTSVPVSLLVSQVATGRSLNEVARDNGVRVGDVRAALEYAARRAAEPAIPSQPAPATSQLPEDTGALSPLAAEEARRLGLDVTKMSPLGRELLEIRARGIAAGESPLLTWDELDAEIAERRGGVYPYPDANE